MLFTLVNEHGNVQKIVKDERKRDELVSNGYKLVDPAAEEEETTQPPASTEEPPAEETTQPPAAEEPKREEPKPAKAKRKNAAQKG